MAYMAKSITWDEINTLTKTTASGTAETIQYIDLDTPIYTVPTGRIAKVMYLQFTASGKVYDASHVFRLNASPTVYIKINNEDNDAAGRWLTTINAVDPTAPKCIYLGAGDTLYAQILASFTSESTFAAGSTYEVYPSLYMSIIEEY